MTLGGSRVGRLASRYEHTGKSQPDMAWKIAMPLNKFS
jgi:hypothetical protein